MLSGLDSGACSGFLSGILLSCVPPYSRQPRMVILATCTPKKQSENNKIDPPKPCAAEARRALEREKRRFCDNISSMGNSIHAACYHKIEKKGINGQSLSHNQAMENKKETQNELTKDAVFALNNDGVVLSAKEAAEYCEYKKQSKRAEIKSAILKSEGVLIDNGEVKKICERAVKHRQAAVRMTPSALEYVRPWVTASGVKVDCLIGGDGETLTKVKTYEAKCALRLKAKELTVTISPSMIAGCRYGSIRKELKRLRRVAGKAVLKARLSKRCSPERLAQVSKICSDVGVDYLSLPLYDGCERAKSGLSKKCRLEVFGVETLADYKKMASAGVERIVTDRVEEIQTEWLKEVEKIAFPNISNVTRAAAILGEVKKEESKEKTGQPVTVKEEDGETTTEKEREQRSEREKENDYECRLEGAELKFL